MNATQTNCPACRAGLANQAEQDRQTHLRKLDAAYADTPALVVAGGMP